MTQDFRTIFDDVLFFSKVSHELRTPIHGIRGLSEYLRDNWSNLDDSAKKSYIDDISKASDFLNHLIEKLFQLAHLNSHNNINCHFEKVNIIQIIKTVVEQNNLFIIDKNSVNLFLECNDEEIFVTVDQFWIKQLLSNLINNSIKHSGAKNIMIKIDSQSISNNKNLIISVIDDGLGVPQNELDSLFDPFKQGSNVDKSLIGSGLGLTICKEIVSAHGGKMWIKNNDEGGINISFSLPEKKGGFMKTENSLEKNVILFIDDEKICHTLIDLIIPNFTKYKVINAYNAAEAISLGTRYANDICLVLSDIMLPDMNGYEIYNYFKKNKKMHNVPFIFQSGLPSQESELRRNLIDTTIQIIYKPYKQADLLAAIAKVLDK